MIPNQWYVVLNIIQRDLVTPENSSVRIGIGQGFPTKYSIGLINKQSMDINKI